jgi:PAS domain S-box-containing protein
VNDGFRILMVDDNPDDRMLIRRALVREFPEVEIIEVGDPKGLADALDDGPFDLVITDYGLDFTDGFALLDRLKAQWPECPVILCTGTLSEEIAVEALRKGLDDYVLKDPRRFMRLPAAVRTAIDHARQRSAARAAERRYHELFDGAPVGLIRSLPDGRILAANAAAVRITGYASVSALLDASVVDLYADIGERARVVGALERGETLHDVEIQGRRRDGVLIWVTVNVRPVKDVGGRTLHYEWSLADARDERPAARRPPQDRPPGDGGAVHVGLHGSGARPAWRGDRVRGPPAAEALYPRRPEPARPRSPRRLTAGCSKRSRCEAAPDGRPRGVLSVR